ncbi:protein kinase [Streptomyces sp. NBC_00249]|uniref:serine/threonine-protein kinase n=1 Tax=Streptomyces sp. NBC_00249 TaxID=2975690 RepID=UPI00225A1C74|nr:serine/threonine-protein kinase [Streptomyces sp. NBC_00249]MCX5197007.1 protein kinase [Streptomyces sp. NBC_00249]
MELIGPSGPSQVGPFRVLGVLGEGGMGRVLLGTAPDGRLVAVKQVLARFADDEGFRARFRREVAASRKVSGAYTAAVMEADADAETPWLASVFVPGPSLGAAVEAAGALPEETVRRLAAGLASALAEIHRAGLVHRDLKPENVLLAEDGVRVIDLGIARAAESGIDTRLTHTGLVIGSPAFMSPEQAEGRELTAASDVFSLGSVLFLAATGRNPFAGTSTLQTLYDVVHAKPELDVVPAGLRQVVERCLAKDPAARPAPAELFALLGPVVPAGRQPWPPAVHRMIAEQGAAIDRLLGGPPARTAVRPQPEAPEPAPEPETVVAERVPEPTPAPEPVRAAPSLVPLPEEAPVTVGSLAPGRSPRPASLLALLVVAGALVVTGLGFVVYSLQSGEQWDQSGYKRPDSCGKAAPKLPLPVADRAQKLDSGPGADPLRPVVRCYWFTAGASRAVVEWDVQLSGKGQDGTQEQRKRLDLDSKQGVVESADVGFGERAMWKGGCELVVHDQNLRLYVSTDHGKGTDPIDCRPEAEKIARAALKAVPSN